VQSPQTPKVSMTVCKTRAWQTLIVEAKSNGKADWGLERIARQSGVEFALLSIHIVQHPNTTRHFSHVQHQLVLVERELNWRYPFWNH